MIQHTVKQSFPAAVTQGPQFARVCAAIGSRLKNNAMHRMDAERSIGREKDLFMILSGLIEVVYAVPLNGEHSLDFSEVRDGIVDVWAALVLRE